MEHLTQAAQDSASLMSPRPSGSNLFSLSFGRLYFSLDFHDVTEFSLLVLDVHPAAAHEKKSGSKSHAHAVCLFFSSSINFLDVHLHISMRACFSIFIPFSFLPSTYLKGKRESPPNGLFSATTSILVSLDRFQKDCLRRNSKSVRTPRVRRKLRVRRGRRKKRRESWESKGTPKCIFSLRRYTCCIRFSFPYCFFLEIFLWYYFSFQLLQFCCPLLQREPITRTLSCPQFGRAWADFDFIGIAGFLSLPRPSPLVLNFVCSILRFDRF